jgi:dihydroxy-acid dehydratase
LARRRGEYRSTSVPPERGYASLYERHILSATDGCDFDFLAAKNRG